MLCAQQKKIKTWQLKKQEPYVPLGKKRIYASAV